ncbi:MAG TPA: glycosyltransferase family 2 protein [Armatimonadota bacterium]|nr:glycosyltransferase family 2 protein [Armatimonadota bacterium]
MPLVSVVVPNWNGERLLPACLNSLRAQTFREVEIIVSDDGSTDGSVELLKKDYPEVAIVGSPVNRGFCEAANAGIRASRGEFVLLLNNDTELDPRCVEELARAMEANEQLGICAAKMVYFLDPTIINSAGHACRRDGVVVDIGRGERDGEWFDRPREVLGASGGAALYRRRMLQEIGLFDPDFVTSVEDVDLEWRAQWAGWRAQYLPTAVVKHREGISRGIEAPHSALIGLRNTINVWTKSWPASALLRHFPDLWRGWQGTTVSLIRRGYGGVLPAVVWGVLVQMPRMLSRRRALRRGRNVSAGRFEELLALGERHTRRPPED